MRFILFALILVSCINAENVHLTRENNASENGMLIEIDLDEPNPNGYTSGDNYRPTGTCSPSGSPVGITSAGIVTSPLSCSCSGGLIDCPTTTISTTESSITASISSGGETQSDDEFIHVKPSFSCIVSPMATGSFIAGETSTGTLAIPITDSVDANVSISVSGSGFSGVFNGAINNTDNVVIIPINYDGSGLGGAPVSITLASGDILGSCSGQAHVMDVFDEAFGIYSSRYSEDGTDGICAKNTLNEIYCWGNQSQFHGGAIGSSSSRPLVLQTMPPGAIPLQPLPLEANGFAITTTGELISWGEYQRVSTHLALGRAGVVGAYNPPDYVTGWNPVNVISQLHGEHNEVCVLLDNTEVWCWGKNQKGELGLGDTSSYITPQLVTNNVAKLWVGGDVHCVLKFDGKLYCAGEGSRGQQGDGSNSDNLIMTEVSITDVQEVSMNGNQSIKTVCALKTDRTVWCWGRNNIGQLGDGNLGVNSNVPVQVSGLTDVQDIRGGIGHMCAMKQNGEVWCWGDGTHGQLGNGASVNSDIPVQVVGITNAVSIGVGQDHSCAYRSDQTVWCWGEGNSRRLGNGITADQNSPVQFGSAAIGFPAILDGLRTFRYDTCVISGDDAYCVGVKSGNAATILNSPKISL